MVVHFLTVMFFFIVVRVCDRRAPAPTVINSVPFVTKKEQKKKSHNVYFWPYPMKLQENLGGTCEWVNCWFSSWKKAARKHVFIQFCCTLVILWVTCLAGRKGEYLSALPGSYSRMEKTMLGKEDKYKVSIDLLFLLLCFRMEINNDILLNR